MQEHAAEELLVDGEHRNGKVAANNVEGLVLAMGSVQIMATQTFQFITLVSYNCSPINRRIEYKTLDCVNELPVQFFAYLFPNNVLFYSFFLVF